MNPTQPSTRTILETFDTVATDNPDMKLSELIELVANETGTDTITVTDVVFELAKDHPA